VTGLSSRTAARTLLMDRPRGVGGGAKLMSAPRTEDPERERSASMPESAIGMTRGAALAMARGARDGCWRWRCWRSRWCCWRWRVLVLLALLPLALPALVLAGTRARRLERDAEAARQRDEASGLVRGRQQPPPPPGGCGGGGGVTTTGAASGRGALCSTS
jgi:hypothetical protein